MEERDLLELARHGSLPAFNRLVVAYQDQVYWQALCLSADPRLAEDVAQAAFLLAFRNLGSYRGGALRLWLLGLVTDLCRDELKRQASRGLAPTDDECRDDASSREASRHDEAGVDHGEALEIGIPGDVVRRGLMRLPVELRAAVALIDIQGLDYAEAAVVLHTTVRSLTRRLAQGRLWLGAYLRRSRYESPREAVV